MQALVWGTRLANEKITDALALVGCKEWRYRYDLNSFASGTTLHTKTCKTRVLSRTVLFSLFSFSHLYYLLKFNKVDYNICFDRIVVRTEPCRRGRAPMRWLKMVDVKSRLTNLDYSTTSLLPVKGSSL